MTRDDDPFASITITLLFNVAVFGEVKFCFHTRRLANINTLGFSVTREEIVDDESKNQ